uniref:Uncharacterized protein n=1 Tax=Rhizophora mucronata TaxID=61149 RepID=A0A2P2MKF7_RHIMU
MKNITFKTKFCTDGAHIQSNNALPHSDSKTSISNKSCQQKQGIKRRLPLLSHKGVP